MISVNRRTLYGEVYNDVRCLSSDEKPTEGVKNGSTLIEIDTGKRYLYDALSGSWNEFSQGGGGGGEYVLPTMSPTTKGGATVGDGLTMDGTALSVDFTEVASVDALEDATALSPTGGIVSTQDGLAISPEQSSTGAIDGALLELTAKSKPATQITTDDPPSPSPDYPQPIVTVRGRNLIDPNAIATHSPEYYRANDDGSITALKKDNRVWADCSTVTLDAGTYTIWQDGFTTLQLRNMTDSVQVGVYTPRQHATFTLQSQKVIAINASYYNTTFPVTGSIQLTLGSTPQPYVPYGHVGLERRDSQGTLLGTTPIPLPSRGWVAGLPDGAADELSVDGAGKCGWTLQTDETTTAATDGITGTVGVDVMSTTGQIADGATVLYPLATPVTEDCGYIEGWTNDFSEGCVLSIPELDDLGIKYHIDGAVSTLVHQWYERARYEYEDRIDALESAVAELVAGA